MSWFRRSNRKIIHVEDLGLRTIVRKYWKGLFEVSAMRLCYMVLYNDYSMEIKQYHPSVFLNRKEEFIQAIPNLLVVFLIFIVSIFYSAELIR